MQPKPPALWGVLACHRTASSSKHKEQRECHSLHWQITLFERSHPGSPALASEIWAQGRSALPAYLAELLAENDVTSKRRNVSLFWRRRRDGGKKVALRRTIWVGRKELFSFLYSLIKKACYRTHRPQKGPCLWDCRFWLVGCSWAWRMYYGRKTWWLKITPPSIWWPTSSLVTFSNISRHEGHTNMRGLHGQLVHLSPAMGKMEVDMQGKAAVVQKMLSACSHGGFFQLAIKEAKQRGHRLVQEFIALLSNFLLG